MKNFLFGLLATLSLTMTSCAQTIGIVDKDNYKITCDTDVIKKDWEMVLYNQKTPAELVNFEIIANKIESSEETYYLLLARNRDNSVKIGRRLQLIDNKFSFFAVDKKSVSLSDTVTCSGCPDGCTIQLKSDGNWKCTACIEGSGCSKSETHSN